MKLNEIYTSKLPISFEVFPPKDDFDGQKTEKLIQEMTLLEKFSPEVISITYGAGGTNQKNSLELTQKLKNSVKANIMPHFTCINSTKDFVENYLEEIKKLGIENILALRGDIPDGMEHINFEFQHAADLIKFIKSKSNLSIGVAGYPEGHNDCKSIEKDIFYLKQKVDSGADAIFTQLFFDNSAFYKFLDMTSKTEINIPVVAGIMPVLSHKSLVRMLSMSNAKVPNNFMQKLEKHKDDTNATTQIGIEFAIEQCKDLIKNGVNGLHFFTLNKSYATSKILENIL